MDIIVVNMIKKAAYARKHAGVAFNITIVYLELEGHFLAANQQNSNRHSVTNLFLNFIIALFIWSPGQGKAPPIAISSTDTRKTPYYSPRKNRFTPKINTITEFFKKFRRSLGVNGTKFQPTFRVPHAEIDLALFPTLSRDASSNAASIYI